MPDLDNPKPFIEFDNIGNNMYVPRFREGGLTPEVINSGDPKVLRAFFDEQGDKLHSDELAYLKARIVAADEIERLSSKASRDISQGKDHPVEPLDNNGGYTGFSNLKYPGEQTSANGCWSCAYSLILKSRGVQLSQEKIRAWRPSYSKTEDASSPAAQNLWYKRNADTDMEIPYNVDMLAQVLPNTSMVSYSMSPLSLENITLTDPRTGMPVEMTQQRATEIKNQHKRQAINNMRTTIENAIKVDKSPVAVVVDGHYITITGMDAQGRLRYEDSVYPVGQTTRYMTIEQLYHIGHERHRKKVDANTYVEVEPKGIAFNWIRDIDVPEYKQGEISRPDYKDNGDIIRVDAQGNASVAIPKNEKFRTSGGSLANGNLSTLGVMSSRNMDLKDLEDRLGVKINSFGVNGGYTLGNLDTYYPSKVLAKNDPKLAPENAITGDKTMRRFGSELVRLSQTEMKGKPWSGQLRDLGRSIVLLTNAGTSPEQRKAALETVKGLPAVLSLKDGSKSVLQTICDDAYSSDNWGEKGKLINNVNTLNNKLGLGMDVGAAMGKAAGTVYSGGDMMADAETAYYMSMLDGQKIANGQINSMSAEASLAYLVALKQLRKDKYEDMHAYPPNSVEITVLKNKLQNSPTMARIKDMGIANFLAMGSTPEEIYRSFKTVQRSVEGYNMGAGMGHANRPNASQSAPRTIRKPVTPKPVVINNQALNAELRDIDEKGRDKYMSTRVKAKAADDEICTSSELLVSEQPEVQENNVLEGVDRPDEKLAQMMAMLTAKNSKVPAKVTTAISKALKEYQDSYMEWENANGSFGGIIQSDLLEHTTLEDEAQRYTLVNDAAAKAQEKNKALSDTISKFINKKGSEKYRGVLQSALETVDDARIYMDDRQLQNDLDHVKNVKLIDMNDTSRKLDNLCYDLETQAYEARTESQRLFLTNKARAMRDLGDIALTEGSNQLSEMEKEMAAPMVASLLFGKITQNVDAVKNQAAQLTNQEQYDAAVMDITASKSFGDLINGMDRESLRHIISSSKGRDDLYKNFIKKEYMTSDEIKNIKTQKKEIKRTESISNSKKHTKNIKK